MGEEEESATLTESSHFEEGEEGGTAYRKIFWNACREKGVGRTDKRRSGVSQSGTRRFSRFRL